MGAIIQKQFGRKFSKILFSLLAGNEVIDMGEPSVPKAIKPELAKLGLKLSDIIFCCYADLTPDASFGCTWVLLTESSLYLMKGDGSVMIRTFSGYPNAKAALPDAMNFTTEIYSFTDISEVFVVNQTVGGILCVKDKSGEETALCYFSSKYTFSMQQCSKVCTKLIKGETLTELDLKAEESERYCPKCGALYPDPARKICPNCLDKRSIISRFMSFCKPYRGRLILASVCVILSSMVTLIIPYLNGTVLFDNILSQNPAMAEFFGPDPDFAFLLLLCTAAIIVSQLVIQVLSLGTNLAVRTMSPSIIRDIKNKVFSAMSKLGLDFYTNHQTGSLLNRVLNDAQEISYFLVDGVPQFFSNVFLIIFATVFMLILNWKLALFAIVSMPVLLIIFKLSMRTWRIVYSIRSKRERKLSSIINDNITGARVVKAFGSEKNETRGFEKSSVKLRSSEIDIRKQSAKISVATTLTYDIIYYGVICIGAILILSGDSLDYGMLVTFTGYVSMLNQPLQYFSDFFNWGSYAMTATQRIFEIIDTQPDIVNAEAPITREVKGDIEFKNVVFGYVKERDVIKDVSFKIESGHMLGIVGHSGTGKSTLVNLLMRLYDVNSGEILIDGVNIKDYSIDCLRRSISIVSQETFIFIGSVLDNIRYGRPEAGFDEVVRAAKAAYAHDFIMAMPDGYDTVIGSSQRQLSGGERQRISIARAILANSRILILDEATASVDTQTERAIQSSIDRLIEGRTTISIAHRLSTLKNADDLIVIEDGKIAERGTGPQLLEQKGVYYKLYQLQTKSLAMRGLEE